MKRHGYIENCSIAIECMHFEDIQAWVKQNVNPNTYGAFCLIKLLEYDYENAYSIIIQKADPNNYYGNYSLNKVFEKVELPSSIIDKVDPNTEYGSLFCIKYIDNCRIQQLILDKAEVDNRYGSNSLIELYEKGSKKALDKLFKESDENSDIGSKNFIAIRHEELALRYILNNVYPSNIHGYAIYQALADDGCEKAILKIANPNEEKGCNQLCELVKEGCTEAADVILFCASLNTEFGAKCLILLSDFGNTLAIDIINNTDSLSKTAKDALIHLKNSGKLSLNGEMQLRLIDETFTNRQNNFIKTDVDLHASSDKYLRDDP